MKRSLPVFVIVLGLAFSPFAASTQAAVIVAPVEVEGSNAVLDQTGGLIFIPQQLAKSGTLGDPIPPLKKHKYVGLKRDTVRLRGQAGASTDGFLSFRVAYDVSVPMGVDAVLKLTFDDLDFLPQQMRRSKLTEWLEVTAVRSSREIVVASEASALASAPADLVINASNYDDYRQDKGGPTNNVGVTYTIPLVDLGLSKSNIYAIDMDGTFYVDLKLYAEVERTKKGSGRYRNTNETLDAALVYTPDYDSPEPMTLGLLLIGLPLVIRRRIR